MPRPLTALSAMTLFLATSLAAPVPKGQREPINFPAKVGAKWVYRSGDSTRVRTVVAVDERDRAKVVRIAREEDGREIPIPYYLVVSTKGVAEMTHEAEEIDPPPYLLKIPHTPGSKWEYGPGKFEAFGAERVTVPAGTFVAVRVEMKYEWGNSRVDRTEWYADKVGVVRYAEGDGNTSRVWVLTAFTPGKDKP